MTAASPSTAPPKPSATIATTADGKGAWESFLNQRAIDPEVAARLGLRDENGEVVIPYYRKGKLIYRKYRTYDKKFRSDSGITPFFWNVDVISDKSLEDEPLLITEGELDAVAAIQAGFVRTISVPNGAPSGKDTASLGYLDEPDLKDVRQVIICSDNDEKGANLLHDLSTRLGKARCKWVEYPDGCKDLNDVLRKHGEEGIRKVVRAARWVPVAGVYKMSELPPAPYTTVYDIGIEGFEKYANIRMGDISIVTGIPSMGKTTLVNDIISRMHKKHGLKTAFASLEQHPTRDHRRNLRIWHSGKWDFDEEERKAADKWIDEAFSFIVPSYQDEITLEWIFDTASAAIIRDGVKILVIDPWNEMDHFRDGGETETEYVSSALRRIHRFAMKFMIHVMIVAHPAKMQKMKDTGEYPVPDLYDISGSANFYNKCDLGLVVHRTETGTSVFIRKARYEEIGQRGVVDVHFSKESRRYSVVDNKAINRGK